MASKGSVTFKVGRNANTGKFITVSKARADKPHATVETMRRKR